MYIFLLSSRIWEFFIKVYGGKPASDAAKRKEMAKTDRYVEVDGLERRF